MKSNSCIGPAIRPVVPIVPFGYSAGMLIRIELPRRLDQIAIPPEVAAMIADVRARVITFQDRWDVPQIEQFVAADYELVYQTLAWIDQSRLATGGRFVEWGCGFAAVVTAATRLGWDCVGIESEAELLVHGRRTLVDWVDADGRAELVQANFLPHGAEDLADDPTLPSLGHGGDCAYDLLGLDLDDFAIVYSYPWPGEDDFHECVFDRYAAPGALLVHFRGPNEMAVWQKRR